MIAYGRSVLKFAAHSGVSSRAGSSAASRPARTSRSRTVASRAPASLSTSATTSIPVKLRPCQSSASGWPQQSLVELIAGDLRRTVAHFVSQIARSASTNAAFSAVSASIGLAV